ncbi:hypothetical protein, partial [Bradyrhizobium sp. 62]|uniref:hypothetical protein n=1 Tax=Bradyrhizobium sp. 62 TaxID=1043588 RepID=UPI001FFC2452
MTGIEPAVGAAGSCRLQGGYGATTKKRENNPMHSRDEVEKAGENFVCAEIIFRIHRKPACSVGQNTGMMASSNGMRDLPRLP